MPVRPRSYSDFLEWCEKQNNALAERALVIARNEDDTNRTGHIHRGYLASVEYLKQNPDVQTWLSTQPLGVSRPVDTSNRLFSRTWKNFLRHNRRRHAILGRILPRSLGGQTRTGGGGAYPFKIALRLAADYLLKTHAGALPAEPEPKYRMVRHTEFDRDYAALNKLKARYDYRCQVCGMTIDLGGGQFYCEGHPLRPLGRDHNGSADVSNVVILCPNHHTEFDYFLFAILDLTGKKRAVEHMYRELGRNERSITIKHRIARENVDYVIEHFLTRLELYFVNEDDGKKNNHLHR